jgi:hypothetical protein
MEAVGGLLPLRRMAVEAVGVPRHMGPLARVQLHGGMVILKGRLPSCSRVEGVGAPHLASHLLTLPGGLAY